MIKNQCNSEWKKTNVKQDFYNVTIIVDPHISKIQVQYYDLNKKNVDATLGGGKHILLVTPESSLFWEAVAKNGYEVSPNSGSFISIRENQQIEPGTNYEVNELPRVFIERGVGVSEVFLSANRDGSNPFISGTPVAAGQTVYGFARIPNSNYYMSDTEIAGINLYRIGTKEASIGGDNDFGRINAERHTGSLGLIKETGFANISYEYYTWNNQTGEDILNTGVLTDSQLDIRDIALGTSYKLKATLEEHYESSEPLTKEGFVDFGHSSAGWAPHATPKQYEIKFSSLYGQWEENLKTSYYEETLTVSYSNNIAIITCRNTNDTIRWTNTFTPLENTAQWSYFIDQNHGSISGIESPVTGNLTITGTAEQTINKYPVIFTVGTGISSAYTSTGVIYPFNPSGYEYDYGSQVNCLAIVKDGYSPQEGWNYLWEVATGRLYKIGSLTVSNNTNDFGTINALPNQYRIRYTMDMNHYGGFASIYTVSQDTQSVLLGKADKTGYTINTPTTTQGTVSGNNVDGYVLTLPAETYGDIEVTWTATINQYPVTILGGEGVSSVYLSDTDSVITGDPSGTSYNYDSYVYGFVVLEAGYYPYGPQSWSRISGESGQEGAIYSIGFLRVNVENNTFGTINATNVIPCTVTTPLDQNISSIQIRYKSYPSGDTYIHTYTKSTGGGSVTAINGTVVTWTLETERGYTILTNPDPSIDPFTITKTLSGDYTLSYTTSNKNYVYIKNGTGGIVHSYLSTDRNALNWPSIEYHLYDDNTWYGLFPIGSQVYAFTILNPGGERYQYSDYVADNSWTLISGSQNQNQSKYRVHPYSLTVSENYRSNFGVVNALPKTKLVLTNSDIVNTHITSTGIEDGSTVTVTMSNQNSVTVKCRIRIMTLNDGIFREWGTMEKNILAYNEGTLSLEQDIFIGDVAYYLYITYSEPNNVHYLPSDELQSGPYNTPNSV